MIKITCEIEDYSEPREQNIKIHNHWRSNKFVEIEVGGKRYTIDGRQLKTAIDNCMNTGV